MSKNNVVNISFPVFGLVGLCLIIAKLGVLSSPSSVESIPLHLGLGGWSHCRFGSALLPLLPSL